MAQGIDTSTYQGNYNPSSTGKEFFMIRSSYGVGYVDAQFHNLRKKLREQGKAFGTYHYAYPQYNTPENEARWYLKTVSQLEAGEVLALDMEEVWSNFEDWRNWAAIFLETIFKEIGNRPLLYINLSKATQGDWSRVVKGNFGLWLALWDGKPDSAPATQWAFIAMKQYSATGKVNGISGDVDLDTFFGDINTFKKYGYQPPAPTPDVIVYQIMKNGALLQEFGDEATARLKFEDKKNEITEGSTIILIKYNKTSGDKAQLDAYTRPIVPVVVYGVDLSGTAGIEFEFPLESDAVNAFALQKTEMAEGETIDLLKITRTQGEEDVIVRLDKYTKPITEPEVPTEPIEPEEPGAGFDIIKFILNLIKKILEKLGIQ